MATGAGRKTLKEIAADLEDTAPKDFDPEAFGGAFDRLDSSEGEASDDDEGAREHYEAVGKSKLRKHATPTLGPQYAGSKISRDALTNGFDEDFLDDDDDDNDPFAKRDSGSDGDSVGSSVGEGEDEQDYDDPDKIDLANHDIDDNEEIDSDEAFDDGDEELFRKKGFSFRGSKDTMAQLADGESGGSEGEFGGFSEDGDINMEDVEDFPRKDSLKDHEYDDENEDYEDEDSDLGDEFSGSDETSNGDTEDTSPEEQEPDPIDRAALREMMASEQKSIVARISEATRADAAKGAAVKQQYAAFDSLVGTRIQLQKALVAMNSLSAESSSDFKALEDQEILAAAAQSAETAALNVLNSITALYQDLDNHYQPEHTETTSKSRKRPFSATLSTPTSAIRSALSSPSSQARQRSTLTKWSTKTQPATSLAPRNKLASTPTTQPLTTALDTYLQGSSLSRAIQRTQTPRSCAPLQQADANITEDPAIFDDADYYALLLRELIDHKKSFTANPSSSHASSALVDEATIQASSSLRQARTHRKNVDTKASKGRKMRFTVHEKLLNFVAPLEPPAGAWGNEAAAELFRGLFGRKEANGKEEVNGYEHEDEEEEREVEGLRLFARR